MLLLCVCVLVCYWFLIVQYVIGLADFTCDMHLCRYFVITNIVMSMLVSITLLQQLCTISTLYIITIYMPQKYANQIAHKCHIFACTYGRCIFKYVPNVRSLASTM